MGAAPQSTEGPYEYTLRHWSETARNPVILHNQTLTRTIEMTTPPDTDLHVQYISRATSTRNEPDHYLVTREGSGHLSDFGGGPGGRRESDTQDEYRVGEVGAGGESHEEDRYLAGSSHAIQAHDGNGSLRISILADGYRHHSVFMVAASKPVQVATHGADDPLRGHMGHDSEPQIETPYFDIYGESRIDLHVDQRFLGFARSHDEQVVRVHAPDGTVTPREGYIPLVNPDPGDWRFEFAQTIAQDPTSHKRFYGVAGAFFPDLGLYDGPARQMQ